MITKGLRSLFLVLLSMFSIGTSLAVDGAESVFEQRYSSKKQAFTIKAHPKEVDFIPINRFHRWVINIQDKHGKPVYPARVSIGGGMPSHGHGLPTQPVTTKYLGNGNYLIEGFKFNMDGDWLIQFRIVTPDAQDAVEMHVEVNY